jgi:hypothetical protein
MNKKQKAPEHWFFFGIWGLHIINDHEHLEPGLWGDATILSQEQMHFEIVRKGLDADAVSAIMNFNENTRLNSGLADLDALRLSAQPSSFLAIYVVEHDVRKALNHATQRALELLSMLNVFHSVHARIGNSFQLDPRMSYWHLDQSIHLDYQRKLNLKATDVASSGHSLKPITVPKEDIINSSYEATSIITYANKKWSLSQNYELLKIFKKSKNLRSNLDENIIKACIHLSESLTERNPSQKISKAVTAYEMLLMMGNSEHKKLEPRIKNLVNLPKEEIDIIMKIRNDYTHEGKVIKTTSAESHSVMACIIGMYIAFMMAELSKKFDTKANIVNHLDFIHHANRMKPSWDDNQKEMFDSHFGINQDLIQTLIKFSP